MSKSKRDREEPCYICGHYHDFEGGQACGICGHVMTQQEKKHCETVLPIAIIPGFLYLGSYDTASRSEILKAMAITHILNTVPTCEALYRNTFQYHTASSSPPDFQECIQFIDSVKQTDNGKVLVYCMSGVSRSPTIVIAYLMKTRGWRLLESYKWVKEKRGSIHINAEDTKRLLDLELQTYSSSSVPAGFEAIDAGSSGSFAASTSGMATAAAVGPSSLAAPAFSVPSGQSQWSLSPGAPGQPMFGNAAAAPDSRLQFVFGAPASGQGGGSPNTEMEM